MTEEEARQYLRELPEYDGRVEERLEKLAAMLRVENQIQNLVAAPTINTVWARHMADSAQLLQYVPRGTSLWLDLGSGAGFPGLVVAILRPHLTVTLVESRTKRIEWLWRVIEELGLEHTAVAGRRLETLADAKVDVISARAFAPLDRLVELAARFSTSETDWLLPKGRSARQELEQLTGWQHTFHVEPSITDVAAGVIVGRLLGKKGKRL